MQTQVNFGGFYHSWHEDAIERAVAFSIGADDEETGEIDHDKLFEFNEWQPVFKSYSKEFIDKLNDVLETNINFISLDSPREYNFSTDVIIVDIKTCDVIKLFKYIKENDLKTDVFKQLKEYTTSCDGYHAFYSYHEMFLNENRYFLIQSILDVILESLNEDYPFIVEEFYI